MAMPAPGGTGEPAGAGHEDLQVRHLRQARSGHQRHPQRGEAGRRLASGRILGRPDRVIAD
eukprot:CAMPEP_0197876184 /NCGR_PEP_ID=MMETSP1439-20131203/5232_1 /TAXON_ID=66791 /ORGANISM="Gonyaulax spinifera, Strain CCMP409" /LENGTH=60 /DNA_ID=CAMNT_0043495457 /DNA_START=23 /DNA_END=202 /DNA_ORIENTATION=+